MNIQSPNFFTKIFTNILCLLEADLCMTAVIFIVGQSSEMGLKRTGMMTKAELSTSESVCVLVISRTHN